MKPAGNVVILRWVEVHREWLTENSEWSTDEDQAKKFSADQFDQADKLAKELGGHAIPHRWEEEKPEPPPRPAMRHAERALEHRHKLFGYED